MKNPLLGLSLALAALVFVQPASSDTEVLHVYGAVGSIDGAKSVHVRRNDSPLELKSGDPVQPGDTVVTDGKTTMTIHCADGSVLVVGRNSRMGIEESTNAQRTARIDAGTLRAIVSKINSEKDTKKKPFRFFIKTRSATLGVRGTDFVVSADETTQTAELHTLEGTVEVAKDEPTIVKVGGEKVVGGESIIATPEEISKPEVFDQKRFAEELKQTQPGLAVPEAQPTPEASPSASPSPSPTPAPTQTPEVDLEPSRTSITSLEAAFRHIDASQGGLDGAEADWTPMLEIFRHWLSLRGTVGFFTLNSGGVFHDRVTGEDFKLVLSLRLLGHIILEFGPTWEKWNSLGGVSGPTFGVGWEFARHQLGALDRIFFSFSPMGSPQFYQDKLQQNQPPNACQGMGPCSYYNTNNLKEYRVGFGLRF